MKLSERALFLIDNLDLPEATGQPEARWEYFQLAHLSDNSTFRIENKSRQIAWSWTAAAEAVANACLYGVSSQFQSINLEEAQEKIRYARLILDNLHIGGLPKITQPDTTTALGFDNGARIKSAPGTPQRGLANFWVYFDEWAHQAHASANYTAALPFVIRGGKVRGGSSPMGASGLFWEIYTESLRKYPGYTRHATPWWEVQAFCKNVKLARKVAPMQTRARVELFGKDAIQAQYANMHEEDFQQEYEAAFVDETTAWITWEEIRAMQRAGEGLVCLVANGVDEAHQLIDALLTQMAKQTVESAFAVGVDIGRTRNTTELFFLGKGTLEVYPLRLMITLDNVAFDDQYAVLAHALNRLPVFKCLIDRNGIGRNLAENAERDYPTKAEGVDFTQPNKVVWATDVKMYAQQNKLLLPAIRDLAYQIHSIKRIVTAARNVVFDSDRNEKHHADKFWALALAVAGVKLQGQVKEVRFL